MRSFLNRFGKMKKKMNKNLSCLAVLTAGFALTGCDSLRHTFGLDHYSADEFNVTENPALSVPPEYNLAPPTPGAVKSEQAASLKAQQKLFGSAHAQTPSAANSEAHFLGAARQGKTVEGNIRETVDKEAEESGTVSDKITSVKNEIVRNLTGKSADEQTVD